MQEVLGSGELQDARGTGLGSSGCDCKVSVQGLGSRFGDRVNLQELHFLPIALKGMLSSSSGHIVKTME